MNNIYNIYPNLKKHGHKIALYDDFLNRLNPQLTEDLNTLLEDHQYVFLLRDEILSVDYIQILHNLTKDIPPGRLFLFAASLNPKVADYYYEYCEELGVRAIPLILSSLIDMPVGQHTQPKISTGVRKKKFLCFNRVPRVHRIMLLKGLHERNLVDQGFVSFGFDPLTPDIVIDSFPPSIKDFLNEHKDKWPLLLDYDDIVSVSHTSMIDSSLYPLFENSYFSVVSETYFFNGTEQDPPHHWENNWQYVSVLAPFIFKDDISITEKTFRAIFHKHPFIIAGAPHSLAKIREWGYQTFSPWIDESYDACEDHEARLEIILEEINRLCSLSDQELNKMINEMADVLEHNYRLYINKPYNRQITQEPVL